MDLKELYARGLALRKKMFGEAAVDKRMQAFGDFGAPLQNIINAYAYGDVWSRTELPDATRSLAMLGITAALNRPAEFRVHVQGALATAARRSRSARCCCWWRCTAGSRPPTTRTASPTR
jgi:4-carboxymuconolactone decarboxylase